MKTNIKKISEQTGFSPATVSNALNHKRGVSPSTASEIVQAAKKLGYVSESNITKIKFVMYKENGLIVEDTPFFPLVIEGFEKECRESGFEMIMCYLDRRHQDYPKQLENLLLDVTAGVVLLGSEISDEEIQAFRGLKTPFLTLEYWDYNMSFNGVFINNADSARVAGEYLIKKGHKEIGYLAGDYRIEAFRSRQVGLEIALNKHGLQLEEAFIIKLRPTMEDSYREMLLYLENDPHLPTAFFADNDILALGAMKALHEKGYRIPEDISMIGFDDLSFCEISSPRLTSLRVPKQQMGQLAAQRMIAMIRNEDVMKAKIQICTDLIERDSVKDLNA